MSWLLYAMCCTTIILLWKHRSRSRCVDSTYLSVPVIFQHRGDTQHWQKHPGQKLCFYALARFKKKIFMIAACCSPLNPTIQLLVFPCEIDVVRTLEGQAKAKPSHTHTFQYTCAGKPTHTRSRIPLTLLLNFGTPRAYDLLIMNLNPLFWVNELKEIGQRMKATGPINGILWCITLARHSTRPLCAFCLYPLCYSLIILSGVRVRVANCADRLSLRMAKDSPNTDTPPDCAQPPWIMPIIPILWFFFFFFAKLCLYFFSFSPDFYFSIHHWNPSLSLSISLSLSVSRKNTHTHTHTHTNKYIVFWRGSLRTIKVF